MTTVLTLLARGDTNAGIATRLAMRESTVKAHVSRVLSALEVTNRVQAAILAPTRDSQRDKGPRLACPGPPGNPPRREQRSPRHADGHAQAR